MVAVLLIDQSDAFNVCQHSILIKKLKLLGLDDGVISWMPNYLTGRPHSLTVEGKTSEPLKMGHLSVIQGGIGSGILYSVMTCDMEDCLQTKQIGCGYKEPYNAEDGNLTTFIDNATASISDKDPENLTIQTQLMYIKIKKYLDTNALKTNVTKPIL